MDLAEAVYRFSSGLSHAERFGLASQLRRAGVSVASNIAEGEGRGGDAEFVQFLKIAHGSLQELETQVILAARMKPAGRNEVIVVMRLAAEVSRLVNGLIRPLRWN